MQQQDPSLYGSFPVTSFAAAAAGAGGPPPAAVAAPSAKGPAPADGAGPNGPSSVGFDAIKRSFEGSTANGVPAHGPPGPAAGPAPAANGSAFPPPGQAGFPAPNGLYGSTFMAGPGYPPQQQPQAQPLQTANGMAVPAPSGNGPVPNGPAFQPPTSPYLANSPPGAAGASPAAVPFGSPVPSAAGPYSGSAFDTTPTSPNPYGGPPLPAQGVPGPYGQTVPAGAGFVGAASPYMMSPMIGMGSPQVGGTNGFSMPYPISGAPRGNFNGANAPQSSTVSLDLFRLWRDRLGR